MFGRSYSPLSTDGSACFQTEQIPSEVWHIRERELLTTLSHNLQESPVTLTQFNMNEALIMRSRPSGIRWRV